jgi:hypothetical protein
MKRNTPLITLLVAALGVLLVATAGDPPPRR